MGPLILANILVISTAKKPVDSAICVILYLEVQIVQNVQHFAILVSINVTVYVKLVKPDAQYPILRHQLIFELQLFLQYRLGMGDSNLTALKSCLSSLLHFSTTIFYLLPPTTTFRNPAAAPEISNDDQAIGAEVTVEACKYYASFDCEKTCGLCDLCTPTSTRAECSTLCKLGREKCTKFCKSGQDRCLTFFANMIKK